MKTLMLKVTHVNPEEARKEIILAIKGELERLKSLKEELMKKLQQLASKYGTSIGNLEKELLRYDNPESDLDWTDFVAIRDMLAFIEKRIKVLEDVLKSNET